MALNKAKRHKTNRWNVQKVMRNPEACVDRIYDLIVNEKYTQSNFHNKLIFEPKLRIIYSLPFYPDRIIHHAMMLVLEPIWDAMMYKHSYACRVGKGQHKASQQCMNWVKKYQYCAQLDISQFYINIDHEILNNVVREKIKDKRMLRLIDESINRIDIRANNICIYKKILEKDCAEKQAQVGLAKLERAIALNDGRAAGVAVGSLTSQWLGNLYMTAFDRFITEVLGHKAYIRFCDDILLFANDKPYLHSMIARCHDFLSNKRRLFFSKVRVFPTGQGVDFCGYRHFPTGAVLMRKRTAKLTKQRMRSLMYELKHGWINKEQAISKIAAVVGWLRHANTHNLFNAMKLDALKRDVEAHETVQ